LPDFLVREDLPPPGGGERVELALQLLPAGRHPCVPDLDLGADERLGDEEVRPACRLSTTTARCCLIR
jgi:hypothetical protein